MSQTGLVLARSGALSDARGSILSEHRRFHANKRSKTNHPREPAIGNGVGTFLGSWPTPPMARLPPDALVCWCRTSSSSWSPRPQDSRKVPEVKPKRMPASKPRCRCSTTHEQPCRAVGTNRSSTRKRLHRWHGRTQPVFVAFRAERVRWLQPRSVSKHRMDRYKACDHAPRSGDIRSHRRRTLASRRKPCAIGRVVVEAKHHGCVNYPERVRILRLTP